MKLLLARLLGKRFILHYPDGYSTYLLPWSHVRPLQQLYGGNLEVIWSEDKYYKRGRAANGSEG